MLQGGVKGASRIKTYTVIGTFDIEVQAEDAREAKAKALELIEKNDSQVEHYITLVHDMPEID